MFKKKLPTKRVVIAGCRDYNNYDEAKSYIDFCLSDIRKKMILLSFRVVQVGLMLLENGMRRRVDL